MLLPKPVLSFIFITSAVVANPLIHRDGRKGTLRFMTKMNLDSSDRRTLPERDRARAHTMTWANPLGKHTDASISIASGLYSYSAQVGVGDPPYYYTLLIDTGSSNTWVGADPSRPYIQTKTSVNTGNHFNVSYSANVTGEEYLDTVILSPELVIRQQSIGAATSTSGSFEGLDGILGIGPTDLTTGTVNNTATVPTVVDNLYSQGQISEKAFGVYLIPSSRLDSTGELTFGGYDNSVITSPIEYAHLTKTHPASRYWGVNQTVSYGDQIIMSNAAGVVDTGTSLILLATDAFQKYRKATGAVMDNVTGMLTIKPVQYTHLKPLLFNIGGVCLNLTPNAQIWPRSLNTAMGGNASAIYLVISDLGHIPDLPIDFIDGYPLLQRFYSVYDTKHQRIGFARTAHTDSIVN